MKLFAKVCILVLLSVTFFARFAYAKGNQPQTSVVLERKEIVNKDYFASGDTVRVSGTVNGDVYVAGGSVIVDGTINGDLFAAGGSIQISGPVKNDIRAMGGALSLGGTVGGNVTLGGGTVIISPDAKITGSVIAGAGTLGLYAPVGRGITAGAGTLTVNNTVGGDVLVAVDQLILQSKTKIAGNVTYWGQQKATIADNVALSGELVYYELPKNEAKQAKIASGGVKALTAALAGMAIMMTIVGVVAMFVLGLVIISLLPSFTDKTIHGMQKNLWGSFGLGIVTVILLPVLAVMAMATVIGIPVGMFLLMALGLLCAVGHIYAALFIGQGVFGTFNTNVHRAWQLLVGLVILGIFTLIPVLGWLARSIFVLIGTGAVLFEKHATYRQMRAKHLV
ncbi:MAG: hypothetical protein AAB542_04295 [Patescibacteria group bacterium]